MGLLLIILLLVTIMMTVWYLHNHLPVWDQYRLSFVRCLDDALPTSYRLVITSGLLVWFYNRLLSYRGLNVFTRLAEFNRQRILVYQGLAQIVDDYDKADYKPIPGYDREHHAQEFTEEQKLAIFKRDGGRCVYCHRQVIYKMPASEFRKRFNRMTKRGRKYFQCDHLVAAVFGGRATLANGVTTCRWCNLKKESHDKRGRFLINRKFKKKILRLLALRQPKKTIWKGCFK